MKAIQVVGYHEPVRVTEVDQPQVRRHDDVVVRIAGAGICRTDLHILQGQLDGAFKPGLPYTLGHENAGWVHETGPSVTHLEPGDPVIVHPAVTCGHCTGCRSGDDLRCTSWRFPGVDGWDGGYAEFMRTSARSVVPLAPGTDPTRLAPHADAGLTAIHAVKRLVPFTRPGTHVVVIGFGGLGHLAIQLLRLYTTASVTVVDTSADRLRWAEEYGPDQVTDDATAISDADVVLDLVGEHDVPPKAMAMLRKGGLYSIVGYGGQVELDHLDMINRELTVMGNQIGSYRDLEDLVELVRQNKVRLETTTFPLTEVNTALEEVAGGRVLGRAVLVP